MPAGGNTSHQQQLVKGKFQANTCTKVLLDSIKKRLNMDNYDYDENNAKSSNIDRDYGSLGEDGDLMAVE